MTSSTALMSVARHLSRGVGCRSLVQSLLCSAMLLSCHDAQRENPVDPELTPAVPGLAITVSDSLGTVQLAWSAYRGAMGFAAYHVLRKEKGLEAVDTLATFGDVQVLAFTDTTAVPEREYEYSVGIVNDSGFFVAGPPVTARSYSITGVETLSATPRDQDGTIRLAWVAYTGPGFEGYEIWRQTFGQPLSRLHTLATRSDISWVDTTAVPGSFYSYSLRTLAKGQQFDTESERPVSFELPAVQLTDLELDSDCACARLAWDLWGGPRFAAYEVVRRTSVSLDTIVATWDSVQVTTFVDSVLDGNTDYFYRIRVRTAWDGSSVASSEKSGLFHALSEVVGLSFQPNTELQAIDLTVADDGMPVAVTMMISSTTARIMRGGFRFHNRLANGSTQFTDFVPDILSPLRAAASGGWIFASAADSDGQLWVAARTGEGQEAWLVSPGAGIPAGLYVDDGVVVAISRDAVRFHLDVQTGQFIERDESLRITLKNLEGLPLQYAAYVDQGTNPGLPEVFLLAAERGRHKVLSRIWVNSLYAGGEGQSFDDGVGPRRGEMLDPLVLAHDAGRQRLVVIEGRGTLQVLDASKAGLSRHYITRWGGFGLSQGEFLVTPPTAVAVAVDGAGWIHVADAATPGGRVQSFAP
jgi:hypothetical protein